MGIWKRFSRGLGAAEAPSPRGKAGYRAYAVGDIHGRLDLLDSLLARIEHDMATRSPKRTFIIFLGDLIDRGANSAGVVERLRTYRATGAALVFLGGNHEEVLLRILAGERKILPHWLKFGGAECARSYGVDPDQLRCLPEEAAIAVLRRHVPEAHRDFLDSFADTFRFGDYLFVHAGIRPGVDIDKQSRMDLRWIREPFLSDTKEHGWIVVHGHTIVPQVEERRNRIAIDTGAYMSGVLTALGIEDGKRWLLATENGEKEKLSAAA
jgi:serine/threonine protein phosphatase 1